MKFHSCHRTSMKSIPSTSRVFSHKIFSIRFPMWHFTLNNVIIFITFRSYNAYLLSIQRDVYKKLQDRNTVEIWNPDYEVWILNGQKKVRLQMVWIFEWDLKSGSPTIWNREKNIEVLNSPFSNDSDYSYNHN